MRLFSSLSPLPNAFASDGGAGAWGCGTAGGAAALSGAAGGTSCTGAGNPPPKPVVMGLGPGGRAAGGAA